jgi:hypothetical protein
MFASDFLNAFHTLESVDGLCDALRSAEAGNLTASLLQIGELIEVDDQSPISQSSTDIKGLFRISNPEASWHPLL